MSTPLLTTKTHIPRVRPDAIQRPHLLERLMAGLPCKPTLVSAPAGFGKTTLLAAWAAHLRPPTPEAGSGLAHAPPAECGASHLPHHAPRLTPHAQRITDRVAWLSLDEADIDPVRLLSYLIASLQQFEKGLGEELLSALQSPKRSSDRSLLTVLINQITDLLARGEPGHRPYILVLDDYHAITAQPVHDIVAFLLEHLPRNLHVAIATRSDPPLPLARLRGRGQLAEVRQADLCFSLEEAGDFLMLTMDLDLTLDQVAMAESGIDAASAARQAAQAQYRRLLSGASAGEVATSEAEIKSAEAQLLQAQAAYDRVEGSADIQMRPEALTLQQATINCEAAKARRQALLDGAREEDRQAALAQTAAAQAQVDQAQSQAQAAQAQVSQAQAAVEAARAQQAQAEDQLALLTTGPTEEELAAARAQVDQAEAALKAARATLDQAALRAPFSGTITAVEIGPGETVVPGQPVLALADLSRLRAETTDLSERDVDQVVVGARRPSLLRPWARRSADGWLASHPGQ